MNRQLERIKTVSEKGVVYFFSGLMMAGVGALGVVLTIILIAVLPLTLFVEAVLKFDPLER